MKPKSVFAICLLHLILLAFLPACSAIPVAAADNLAPNPSFEEGEAGVVRGWEGGHTGVTFIWSEDSARTGRRSICMSDLPAQRSADWTTAEYIPLTEGTTYTFSAYVKGDFDREVYIMVFPVNEAGDYMEGIATNVTFTSTDWTYAEIAFTAPPGAAAVDLDLGTNNPTDTAATGTICYDDVSFE